MTIQAWTFLVSRNQSIDYKTIVAPDFISEAKIRSLLAKVTEEYFTESGQISIREVKGSEVGDFTIVFRSVKASSKDIGEEGNEVLKDPFGREIYWVEGLVFRKSQTELLPTIGEIHLAQAHRELQEKYQEFWYEDQLSISHPINLEETPSTSNNKLLKIEPFLITPKSDLIKYHTPKTQRNRTYTLNKPVKRKADWSKLVFIGIIVIAALLLMGIFGLWKGLSSADICLYEIKTQTISFTSEQISSTNPNRQLLSRIKKLETLKKNNNKAWILVSGTLSLQDPLDNPIEDAVKKQKTEGEKTLQTYKSLNDAQPSNSQNKAPLQSSSSPSPDNSLTANLNTKDIKMTYHPINAAITLLQNKKVDSGELTAIIIKPSASNKSNCEIVSNEER